MGRTLHLKEPKDFNEKIQYLIVNKYGKKKENQQISIKENYPNDYKIYCFNGKPNFILVCSNRTRNLKLDYYDTNWRYIDYSPKEYHLERDKETG